MKLTKEQEELKEKIRKASHEATKAHARWVRLKEQCSCEVIENRGGSKFCAVCGTFYGEISG